MKGTKRNHFALRNVQIFSLRGSRFPCRPWALVFGGLVIEQGLLELQAEKEVLSVRSASQHSGVQQRNWPRELRFINQRHGDFERDLCARIEIAAGGQQQATSRQVQSGSELQELLAAGLGSTDKERDRYGQPVPAATLSYGSGSTHCKLLRLVNASPVLWTTHISSQTWHLRNAKQPSAFVRHKRL